MLKTTAENPARFGTLSKALIRYAILKEHVRHPLMFLVVGATLGAPRDELLGATGRTLPIDPAERPAGRPLTRTAT